MIAGAAVVAAALGALPAIAAATPAPPCRFPGAQTTCAAPVGGRKIVWHDGGAQEPRRHTLLLRRPDRPDVRLHEFEGVVDVAWSPDGRAVAVADYFPGGGWYVGVRSGADLAGLRRLDDDDLGEAGRLDESLPRLDLEWLDVVTLRVTPRRPPTAEVTAQPRLYYVIGADHPSVDDGGRMPGGVIGLVDLPEVLGNPDDCTPTVPTTIRVYRTPLARNPAGTIRVERVAERDGPGSCRPADVRADLGDLTEGRLPIAERAYEAPAAIVRDRRPGWLQIAMPGGSGWIEAAPGRTFHPIEALLTVDALAYLDGGWDGSFRQRPGGRGRRAIGIVPGQTVRVERISRVGGRAWALVELAPSCLEDVPEPAPRRPRGWIPLYDDDGHPTIWFYSRGC